MERTAPIMGLLEPTGALISSSPSRGRVGSLLQQRIIPQVSTSSKIASQSDPAKVIAMANRLPLENLPLEVIHQIFSLLLPLDLASLRLTSHYLLSSATSNTNWRHHFVHSLLPSRAALIDVASVPLCAWSFSYAPDGWFRAYTTLVRVAREDWLHCDDDLKGTKWLVFFKAFLKEGGARSDDPSFYSLVELRTDCTSLPLEGLPLNVSSWYVDARPSLRFPCYPPNVPSRDPFTWCRVMQHVSVLMLTDSPELLDSLVALNSIILDEAVASKQLCAEKRDTREKELKDHTDVALEHRTKDFSGRLKRLHLLRSERQERKNSGSCCSNVELPEVATGESSFVGALEEGSDWGGGHENEDDAERSDGDWGYNCVFEECLLFQHIQQQHALQHSTLAVSPSASKGSELGGNSKWRRRQKQRRNHN